MEENGNSNRARLPLIETVIIVAIFAVVSVVLLNMYVAADRLQGESIAKSRAVITLENVAEELKQSVRAGDIERDGTLKAMTDSGGAYLYRSFDENWKAAENGCYKVSVTTTVTEGRAGKLVLFNICAKDREDSVIATISTEVYSAK